MQRLLALTALLLLSADAFAQAPKAGREKYIDEVDLGFEIKQPKGWELIPPSPNDTNLIAKFAPGHNKELQVTLDDWLFLEVRLVRFDHGSSVRLEADGVADDEAEAEGEIQLSEERIQELLTAGIEKAYDYVDRRVDPRYHGSAWQPADEDYPEELRVRGVEATYSIYEGYLDPRNQDEDERGPVNMYISAYLLDPTTTVSLIGWGPGDDWRDYEKALDKLAKSLQRVEIIDPFEELRNLPDANTVRGQKRLKLHMDAAKAGDWTVYETENYFVVSASDDAQFLEELMERLEAIRAVYEQDYPAEKARRTTRHPETEGGQNQDEELVGDVEEEDPDAANRTVSDVDPLELSKTSTVRVCASRAQYHSFGGPPRSAGYWSSSEEELVIYDDKAYGGRNNTWLVLNHEAFHQYIFYFYGNIAPHSWYNEGTGDFYSGYELRHGRFRLKENSWRKGRIQEMIREQEYVPLKDLVRYSQSEYYGTNDLGYDRGMLYAQGWSLVYFLRTGEQESSAWQDDWGTILDKYLDTLGKTGDLEEAVDKAFEGVDFEALEEAWKDYIG